VVVWALPQSGVTRFQHYWLGKCGVHGAYSDGAIIRNRVQAFLRGLGYEGIPTQPGTNTGFGILSGVGELGRTDYVISPNFGALMRYSDFIVTDLPMTPTKPIDAGLWRFCQTCKKCAELCPSSSISPDNEPSWETSGHWNGGGKKVYHINYSTCLPWRGGPGKLTEAGSGGCNACQVNCVFTKGNSSVIHSLVKPAVAMTSIFNGFFKSMDDAFYRPYFTGPTGEVFVDPEEGFWNRDLEAYPFKGRMTGL
jgi:reductive dehalogenase